MPRPLPTKPAAARGVRQTLSDLVPNPPEVTIGETLSQIRA